MKINNKYKIDMDIFYWAGRQIALIADLLGQFADVSSETKSMIQVRGFGFHFNRF